ncbi:hypothetical protein [Micromonospora endolithica]|uniref:hypothetical protein n=1 Tax=Micromonospora endolithica TaxID=230091 RepID=UPI00164AF357|nr:hypothetical protein [Micromonospora endolithica]
MVDAELPAHVPDRATGVQHQRRRLAPELLPVLALSSHSGFLLLGRMPSQEVSGLRGSLHLPVEHAYPLPDEIATVLNASPDVAIGDHPDRQHRQ